MILAVSTIGELTALLVAFGGVITALWKLTNAINKFRDEHQELMIDLKQRQEQIQHTAGAIQQVVERNGKHA